MPLVQIDLVKGKSALYIQAISKAVQKALFSAWNIDKKASFQVIREHAKEYFIIDKMFWKKKTSSQRISILIITLKRSPAQKSKFYEDLIQNLAKNPKIKKEDIFVSLVESAKENFYV